MFYKELKVIYWLLSLEAEGKWCFKFKNRRGMMHQVQLIMKMKMIKKCTVSNSKLHSAMKLSYCLFILCEIRVCSKICQYVTLYLSSGM